MSEREQDRNRVRELYDLNQRITNSEERACAMIGGLHRIMLDIMGMRSEMDMAIHMPLLMDKEDCNGQRLRKHDKIRFALTGKFNSEMRDSLVEGVIVGETDKMLKILVVWQNKGKKGVVRKFYKRAPKNVMKETAVEDDN